MSARRSAFVTLALFVLGATLVSAATVTGTVKFEGKAPAMKPLQMDADPGCAKKHSSAPLAEALVLGDGQTMANVYVHIKSGLPAGKTWPVPSEPVTLDQHGCQYIPHVVGVMVGQPFKVLNSDGLLHNVHALPKVNSEFNRAMPAAVTEAEYKFDKEEIGFKVKCDVHPWMGAYVSVTNHPFFDVTGMDGKFKIDGLPAGTYEIEVWHERLKTQTAKVTVAEGDTKSVDFSYSRPE